MLARFYSSDKRHVLTMWQSNQSGLMWMSEQVDLTGTIGWATPVQLGGFVRGVI